MAIHFHEEDIQASIPARNQLKRWIKDSILAESKSPGNLNIIFCSDQYLLRINQQFLNHDYYTDIITFDYSESNTISGDLYLSLERIQENAAQNGQLYQIEMYRVVIHGIMHLCGYGDKTKNESKLMRKKEDQYLKVLLEQTLVVSRGTKKK